MERILVVEDDLRMRELVTGLLQKQGYSVKACAEGKRALISLKEEDFDLVVTDLKMPDLDGIDVLAFSKETSPTRPVVVITGYGTIETAVRAMKLGAFDYMQKPFDPDELLMLVKRALEFNRLFSPGLMLSPRFEESMQADFVGTNKSIVELKKMIEIIAPLDATVLVQGETGTGKELVAKLIHKLSSRNAEKFLPVNCGAFAEPLIESEFFGHEKGSFTGAAGMKKGLFEAAHKGAIFLDEINNSSQGFQIKLLRVLQEGIFTRVGGLEPISVDVRVIAASNADLVREAAEGRFRKDLFYRLNVISLTIPPLRERRDDIPLLAHYFLRKYNRKFSKEVKNFRPEALEALVSYQWPGNVRELENNIARALIVEPGEEIALKSLPAEMKGRKGLEVEGSSSVSIEEMEKTLIEMTLKGNGGQKARTAQALGISVSTLWRKLKKYSLA